MTVQTLRPNAVDAAGSFTASPSGTLNGVTSDDSDSTYALGSGTLASPMILDLGAYTLASNERVKLFRTRVRYASNVASTSVAGAVQVASGGLSALLNLAPSSTTTPGDTSTGWQTPTAEVTNNAIIAAELRTVQTISSVAGLRVHELYLDLDVRARPVINGITVAITLGEPTYTVDFTYGTSGNSESVTIEGTLTDIDDAVISTFAQTVIGTDFAAYEVEIPHGEVLPSGDYTITATVTAGGFVAPSTTFDSAEVSAQFSVTPSGALSPDLTCETDQDAQTVILTICQQEAGTPVGGDCLIVESQIDIPITAGFNSGTSGGFDVVNHVTTWFQPDGSATAYMVTLDIALDGENIFWEGTFDADGMLSIVFAYTTPAGLPNTSLTVYEISGPTDIFHGLNTTNIIVQARDTATGFQAELGYEQLGADSLRVTGPFSANVTVLILAEVPPGDETCIAAINDPVAAAGESIAHQFNALFTLATFIDDALALSWPSIELATGGVTNVGPTDAGGTIFISGILATFDDPNAVRVQVQRDGEDISLDGENGALVPAFGDGCLVVVDRFPLRYAAPTCDGDAEPVGPEYRARFYGYVDGSPEYTAWSICQPDAVIHNGQALIRSPIDGDLDVMACVSSEDFVRTRPRNTSQPINGGLPYGRIADWGGRDFTLVIETPDTASMKALEDVFAEAYIWYSPLNAQLEPAWLMPGAEFSTTGHRVPERPYTVTESTTNIDPDPVVLPPFGVTP